MNPIVWVIIVVVVAIIALAGGAYAGLTYQRRQTEAKERELGTQARNIVQQAESQAKETVLKAKDEAIKVRNNAEEEAVRRLAELNKEDQRLLRRREDLDRKNDQLEQRRTQLDKRQTNLDRRETDVNKMQADRMAELQRIAGMTKDEAKAMLVAAVEKDARADMARTIRQIDEQARAEGDMRARKIIATAIQRIASEHVAEISVSVVPLPSDEMKGRIIGRNGRNIRAFEQAAGVDVVVDDTPEAVTVSSFDPIRREVAKRAMAKLVVDGRIHPAHIEKLISDAQRDVEQVIREAG